MRKQSLHGIHIILGKVFNNHETFGAFPLRVQNYSCLHDSLEGALAQGEIEPVAADDLKSGQEVSEDFSSDLFEPRFPGRMNVRKETRNLGQFDRCFSCCEPTSHNITLVYAIACHEAVKQKPLALSQEA